MTKKKVSILPVVRPFADLLVAAALIAAAGLAHAEFRREAVLAPLVVAQLPPDQRRLMRQEMREQWQQVPSDQRYRLREERRDRWQQMPPEDRQRLRDEMRSRRSESGGGFGPGPRGPSGGHRGGRP